MKKIKYIAAIVITLFVLVGCTEKSNMDNNNTSSDVGINLYGTYDQNDLIIKPLEKVYGEITAEIPQIEGLKGKEIQEKINKDMYRQMTEACNRIQGLNYAEYNIMSNFANVISISVYMGSDDEYEQIYLNYNLVGGEKIDFDELFLEDTDTLEIIRNAFYEMLIKDKMSANIDENELYKIVKSYHGSKDKRFAFTPSRIYIYYKDYTASIKMIDIADKIAIYSKYMTNDSLYEKDDIGKKGIMTCATIPENVFEVIDFGYLNENCWFDISIMKEYIDEDFPKEQLNQYMLFKKDRYDEFYEQINRYGEMTKEHPENFYIILSKPTFYLEVDSEWNGDEWLGEYTGNVTVNEYFSVLEMSRETYDDIYENKLLEAYRYEYLAMAGGIYLEVTEDDVQVEEQYNQKTYNYITGEELY